MIRLLSLALCMIRALLLQESPFPARCVPQRMHSISSLLRARFSDQVSLQNNRRLHIVQRRGLLEWPVHPTQGLWPGIAVSPLLSTSSTPPHYERGTGSMSHMQLSVTIRRRGCKHVTIVTLRFYWSSLVFVTTGGYGQQFDLHRGAVPRQSTSKHGHKTFVLIDNFG